MPDMLHEAQKNYGRMVVSWWLMHLPNQSWTSCYLDFPYDLHFSTMMSTPFVYLSTTVSNLLAHKAAATNINRHWMPPTRAKLGTVRARKSLAASPRAPTNSERTRNSSAAQPNALTHVGSFPTLVYDIAFRNLC